MAHTLIDSDDCCCANDPRVSLFLKRHFSIAWEKKKENINSNSNDGNKQKTEGASSGTGRFKAEKKFEKLASSRRSPQDLCKSDEFWSCCESNYERLQQELQALTPRNCDADIWNTSRSLKALRERIYSNQAQDIFKPGDFLLLEKLGKGGMATVYKAIHTPTGHLVALKETDHHNHRRSSGSLSEGDIELKEHRTLPLDCGVVPCYGTFRATSAADNAARTTLKTWMILKLCSEGSLADRLVNHGVLTTRQAAHVLKRVSKTVTYLHTHHGITHNDLKPANILLHHNCSSSSSSSSSFEIYVCDLGVARRGLWQSQRLGGTYSHMSPEKITARKMNGGRYLNDEKIDVWALGIMLSEMLFLSNPYPHFETLAQYPTLQLLPPSSTGIGNTASTRNSGHPSTTTDAEDNNDEHNEYIITSITNQNNTHNQIMDLMEETYGDYFHFPNNKHSLELERQSPSDQLLLLKDLFEQMLNVDFLERMPLSSIKKHPWVKQQQQQGFGFVGGRGGGGFGHGRTTWADRALSHLKKMVNHDTHNTSHNSGSNKLRRRHPAALNPPDKEMKDATAGALSVNDLSTSQLLESTDTTVDNSSSQRMQLPSPNQEVEC